MTARRWRSSAHLALWQRLPRAWRRRVLFAATAAAAPRPRDGVAAGLPVIVAGFLTTASGLGQSARLCHEALKAAGVPVLGIDLAGALMQPHDVMDFAFADGRGHRGPGTVILHVNGPFVPLAMLALGRRLVAHKRIVAVWAWELPRVPPEWRRGVTFVHEIWVPSRFVRDAVAPIAGDRPLHVVPHPVAAAGMPPPRARRPASNSPFQVFTAFNMASSLARKNPCAAIAAFKSAFGDDAGARLVVKLVHAAAYPVGLRLIESAIGGAANITVIRRTMAAAELDALYAATDAVLSLHRAEGFGLVLAEGMMRGLPVIATGWSGNADFLTVDTGFPLPWRPVPARDPQATYDHPDLTWAEPDVEAAAAALRRVRADGDLAARLGVAAAAYARQAWSATAYRAAVGSALGWERPHGAPIRPPSAS